MITPPPRRAVRTFIYRLRQVLDDKECKRIVFSQGCYSWAAGSDCWLDCEEFEQLTAKAEKLLQADADGAIDCLRQAIELYKGEYLPEVAYSEWIIPVRYNYHRMFLEAVYMLIQLLQEKGCHQEIGKLCEKVLKNEPYDEQLHIAYIEYLLAEGRHQQALRHYKYITSMLYKDLGVKPSPAMRAVYKKIQSGKIASPQEIGDITDILQTTEKQSGSFFCKGETFYSILKLEQRKAERTGRPVSVAILGIVSDTPLRQDKKQAILQQLLNIVTGCLRKGDVVSFNHKEVLLLLSNLDDDQISAVLKRVRRQCLQQLPHKNINLSVRLLPLTVIK